MVIFIVLVFVMVGVVVGLLFSGFYMFLLVVVFVVGGVINLFYLLLIVYVNDFLLCEDMVLVLVGFLFVNGCGVVFGLIVIGWLMINFGISVYFLFFGVLIGIMGLYIMYCMIKCVVFFVEEIGSFVLVLLILMLVVMEVV